MNTFSRSLWGAAILCALFAQGCKHSTSSLEFANSTLEIGNPRQLQPPDVLPLAASSDGKLAALWIQDRGGKTGRLLVQELATQKTLFSYRMDSENMIWPLLFTADKLAMLGVERSTIVRFDFSTKRRTVLFDLDAMGKHTAIILPVPYPRNFDHSVLALDGGLFLTNTGKVAWARSIPIRSYFDPQGNAWYKRGTQWHRVDRNGKDQTFPRRPGYLVEDQSHQRGFMRLVEESVERHRKSGDAYLKLIWLERFDVVKGSGAALVFAGPDVIAYGFVPAKGEIYIVSRRGSFIVPFELQAKSRKKPTSYP